MSRALWKGAISFGLVHVPVELYSAEKPNELNFDLLDKRDMQPVGYRHYNKRTGKSVDHEAIVKGYEYAKGKYVVLSDADFRAANVEGLRTAAADAGTGREGRGSPGGHPHAATAGRGHTERGHAGPVHDALRLRDPLRDEIQAPAQKKSKSAVTSKEVEIAMQLLKQMSAPFAPKKYKDTYREELMARVRKKGKAGRTETVEQPETPAEPRQSAKVINLVSLLKRSLGKAKPPRKREAARHAAGRRA